MEAILNPLRLTQEYQDLLRLVKSNSQIPGLSLPRAVRLPIIAALSSDLDYPILVITDRADHALSLIEEVGFWAPSVSKYLFVSRRNDNPDLRKIMKVYMGKDGAPYYGRK